jgi:hypothetical protein
MWYNDVTIENIYAVYDMQGPWVELAGIGWRQIRPESQDGAANIFTLLSIARSHGRTTHVYIDSADNTITAAYLV